MTLQDLGAIGEFIGGIAVVITLVYLAVSIRQNTKSVRASTYQAILDSSSPNYARTFAEKLNLLRFSAMRRDPFRSGPFTSV